MPTILYYWDFETGDTQGWTLGTSSTLNSESKIQGTYSIRYSTSLPPWSETESVVMSITGIDLSTAVKPIILFVIKDETPYTPANVPQRVKVRVYDSGGTLRLERVATTAHDIVGFTKTLVFDLTPVAGMS